MRVLDLFSGIGGFSLGLERAGMQTIAFCEINEWCRRVLTKHWPTVPIFEDVMTLGAEPMSCAEGSLARTSATPGNAPALPAPVPISGGGYAEPFAWYDRPTRSWRTWQRCLVEEWELYSATWPRAGMTRNGTAYQLQPLVPLTAGIESGLWPTPNLPNGGRVIPKHARWSGKAAYLPNGKKLQVGLESAVRMWPTPAARDYRSENCSPEFRAKRDAEKRGKTLPWVAQTGGALNPTWVEWLMGFPLGWTALEPSETPSSRKSRKVSGGQS